MSKEIRISELVIPKLHPVFNDTEHTHIIITSGRAGSKSSGAAIRDNVKIRSDPECSIVEMRKFHNKLKKTIYSEILRGMSRLNFSKKDYKITVSPMQITHKKSGNTIYFTGNDSVDDTKGMIDEAKPIKRVVIDEVTEFFDKGDGEDELSNIEATFIRGNDDEFQMVYLLNPPKNPNAPVMEWIRKMEQRPDVLHVHITYLDVPQEWLGKKLIESAEAMKRMDEKMYRWLWLGECTGLDELIYYMFDHDVHTYDPAELTAQDKAEMGKIGVGVDYGQKNATTFHAGGIDYRASALRIFKGYYHSGRESGKQRSPSEYAKDLKKFCDEIEAEYGRAVSYIFIDPSAAGLKEEARRIMPRITILDAKNDVKLGISRMQKFLSFKKLLISRDLIHLIKEFGLYQYDEKSMERGKEEPLKVNDHCVDGLRYLIMGMWKLIRFLLPVTERGEKN